MNSNALGRFIPVSAVEAAAKMHFELGGGDWEDRLLEDQNEYIDIMRAALEAAAPHIRAQELEAVARDLEDSAQIIQVRSHDAGIDNEATVHAMNTDAEMLRARAAIYRSAK